jgi:class 3 adenylate cyclase
VAPDNTGHSADTPDESHDLEMGHVLFIDIVAYSKMFTDDQNHVLHMLQQEVLKNQSVRRAQARDELISLPTGDGMALVFLGNPEYPVECALALNVALRRLGGVHVRMGIHTGLLYRTSDINASRNVAGGGINMAQRVMDCGDAGHILVSKLVADLMGEVSTWNKVTLQDLGEVAVKHGVRIHVFNLYSDEAGNPALPNKLLVAAQASPPPDTGKRSWRMMAGLGGAGASSNAADMANLATLVRDAESKLRQSERAGAKSLNALPLVYVIGANDSAKTRTVLQSGLDAELLAGQVFRDDELAPTSLVNIWSTGKAAIVEASGTLLKDSALWLKLVRLTEPGKVKTAVSSVQPTRAVVVCVSVDSLLGAISESVQALAKAMNERLHQLSQTLGVSLPVYVLFTKLDLVPGFAQFVRNLSEEEITLPLGATLAHGENGEDLYAERAAANVSTPFDEMIYSLSEFRLELLARGGTPADLAALYEFPRELKKRRSPLVEFLVEIARPAQFSVNPFLRGFFFSGLRSRFVEEAITAIAAPEKPEASLRDAGATRVFSVASQQKAKASPRGGESTRKVWQWVFLPHLLPKLVLEDQAALDTSTRTSKVSLLRRLLAGPQVVLLLVYLGLIALSGFNNKQLEQQARDARLELPVNSAPITVGSLRSLDNLCGVFVALETYTKDGLPLSYRRGLIDSVGDAPPEVVHAQQYLQKFDSYRMMVAAADRNSQK